MKKRRVYVMDCGSFIKIGVSKDPNKRKNQIPYKVMQYYSSKPIDNPFEVESNMHKYFKNYSALDVGKEYFHISFIEATNKLMEVTGEGYMGNEKHEISRLKVHAVGGDGGEETERRISERLKEAIVLLPEFDKGYFLAKYS